ncbi:MAG: cell division protein FtsQ/DivIB [Gemmatimonadota bacterium]
MTRRTRRRIVVAVAAGALGAGSPLWLPRALGSLPAFRVRSVEVVGNRFVAARDVERLAAIPSDASVWDPAGAWEARIRTHPLVRDARVSRAGSHALRIRVREARPVGFVATPGLLPVDRGGNVLPVDPAVFGLDLPIVRGAPNMRGSVVSSPAVRRLLSLLGRLEDLRPSFVRRVSEVRPLPGDGAELVLVGGSRLSRVRLPIDSAGRALLRVEAALAHGGGDAATADALFRDQVILARGDVR